MWLGIVTGQNLEAKLGENLLEILHSWLDLVWFDFALKEMNGKS